MDTHHDLIPFSGYVRAVIAAYGPATFGSTGLDGQASVSIWMSVVI